MGPSGAGGAPGAVLELSSEGARVACGEGSVLLRELSSPAGLCALDTLRVGDCLG